MDLQAMKSAQLQRTSQGGAVTDPATMKPKDKIAHLLNSRKGEIQKMLPKHLNAERLLKVAQIAATTTPGLANCDVPSLIGAIGQCAQMGLEPNTVLGHAYLVPFKTKRKIPNERGVPVDTWVDSVQVIVGYKGLIDLARRSGQIVSLTAHEVCEHDKFELSYGLDEKLNHTPRLDGDRGPVIGFYAIAKLKDGGHAFEFMSKFQVDQIKEKSQSKGQYGPWKDHYVEMGRKTVIRRLAKYLPLSIEFQTAVAMDDQASVGADQHLDTLGTIDGDFAFVDDDARMYSAGPSDEQFEQQVQQVEQQTQRQQRQPAAQQQAPADDAMTDVQRFALRLSSMQDVDMLDAEADIIHTITSDPGEQADLQNTYKARRAALLGDEPAQQPQPAQPAEQKPITRSRRQGMNIE